MKFNTHSERLLTAGVSLQKSPSLDKEQKFEQQKYKKTFII